MIYSYIVKRVEDGGWTGVSRFDAMLRRVFPGMRSVVKLEHLGPDDIVITDNHLSIDAPESIKTVVVHHGCAVTHYERDPHWRTDHTRKIASLQRQMFDLSNRIYVAPSAWVGEQFGLLCERWSYSFVAIPHWVEPIEHIPHKGKPVIIGDWRDHNKGHDIWKQLATMRPEWEFRPLQFRDAAGRRKQYGLADLYLCLSLSEGGSYSMCDAEAAELPIVTTDVGNYREFNDAEVIGWQDRGDLEMVIAAVAAKLKKGRNRPSFYHDYTFEHWKRLWEMAIR